MISAAQRLLLLTGNLGYGLTTIRFYPMILMIWLAVVFGWFALTVLRGAREQFAWGALWTALFMLGIIHVINPDDYIVRTNIRLMQEGRSFDAQYNSNLSDDAVPILLKNLHTMNFEQQCAVKYKLSLRLAQINNEIDFRSWNFSRWKSRHYLNESAENLETAGCPAHTANQHRQDSHF